MICVSISSDNANDMLIRSRAAAARGAEAVEFRIDSLASPTMNDIRLLSSAQVATIATFKGRSVELLRGDGLPEIFESFDLVDVEKADAGDIHIPDNCRERLIISFHGEIGSVGDCTSVMSPVLKTGSIAKCINTGNGYGLSMIPCMAAASMQSAMDRVIAFSTGDEGRLSRIWSVRNGAPVSYACLVEGERTASGQLTIEEMLSARDGYVLGIVGSRAATDHSLSPAIQSALLSESGLSGAYLRFPAEKGELSSFFEAAGTAGVNGFNVTMPFKEEALRLADSADEISVEAGAVNTIVGRNGKFTGYNTDALALAEIVSNLGPESALIFGSGGAGRAASYSLRGKSVSIAARNEESGRELARQFGYGVFDGSGSRFDLLVNCTPIGMEEGSIPEYIRKCRFGAVIDFVYSERQTPFMRLAREQSAKYVGGIEILARQAVHSFRLWTGREIDPAFAVSVIGGAPEDAH